MAGSFYPNTAGNTTVALFMAAGDKGISIAGWLNPNDSQGEVWTNMSSDGINSTRSYTPLALNGLKNAYAIVDGANGSQVWEYELGDDLRTWTKIGPVSTGS